MKILVVNCGSSSIKYRLYGMPRRDVLAKGQVERLGEESAALAFEIGGQASRIEGEIANHHQGMRMILDTLVNTDHEALHDRSEIAAVGHRVVHGGEAFSDSVLIDDEVMAAIKRFVDLAPLHNPANMVGIQAAREVLPNVPQVACFDTAFHATIPKVAYLYGLPYYIYEQYGIRRYGFHGTSHRYVADRTARLLDRPQEQVNCITVHLGNGCSMAAVRGGRSVDTSMGLTPLEGLLMGTRSGDLDPAIPLYLAEQGFRLDELNKLCNQQSGLLGISGQSNDMRALTRFAEAGNEMAKLAIDMFCYRVKKYIGAYMAVLGRVDAVTFTGGIGEHVPEVRSKVCDELEPLGIRVDQNRNRDQVTGERLISSPESRIHVYVVPTDEEGVIAMDTFDIVKSPNGTGGP
ncbi:MAG: acetate/propionate family kinase [Planctomycetota bacterium]